jgi:hypothetical protein
MLIVVVAGLDASRNRTGAMASATAHPLRAYRPKIQNILENEGALDFPGCAPGVRDFFWDIQAVGCLFGRVLEFLSM